MAAGFSCIMAGKQWESLDWERGEEGGGCEEEEEAAAVTFKFKLCSETCDFLSLITWFWKNKSWMVQGGGDTDLLIMFPPQSAHGVRLGSLV